MMADIAKLKRPGKGTPPSMTEAPGNTGQAAREKEEEQRPLQFRVPASVFESFSREAGETFGFKKGAKSELFLRVWEAYKRNKT